MARVEIWTDGAAEPNPGPAGWGAVAKRNGEYTEISGALPKTTNNRAELTAILKALIALTSPGDTVLIHTDSLYCLGVLSKGWKAKKNRDLINAIWKASQGRKITYQHIPGENNWRADFLSRLNLPT